ncbi:glycoside hydrolase family 1 protein [Coprothermobacteraceae bacterium]|nr:glycoside hydrolase family 1 protein [Coprothermobacteraceae bacterium]
MDKFLWGVATAAHQVEGGNFNNDWWLWEQQGGIKTGDSSAVACDHYHRYKEDFELIKFLNNNAYRFSVEWSRIEKEEGVFDEDAIDHYVDMLETLREMRIEPVLTLHHFTIPIWLYNKGGFLNEKFPEYFERFVSKVVPYFKPYVRYWITINEPVVIGTMGYIMGWWPPGHKNMKEAFKAVNHLIKAHARAYRLIKEANPDNKVSIAHNMTLIDPFRDWNPLDVALANRLNYIYNYAILDSLSTGRIVKPFGNYEHVEGLLDSMDFIGINYYTRVFARFKLKGWFDLAVKGETNDFGQEIYPEGILRVLLSVKDRYGKDVMITEHGTADKADKWRPRVIQDTINLLREARKKGVNVIGYMHWSLMDNFEWAEGYSMRFGLFEVDFDTQERKPRRSAYIYREIASEGL